MKKINLTLGILLIAVLAFSMMTASCGDDDDDDNGDPADDDDNDDDDNDDSGDDDDNDDDDEPPFSCPDENRSDWTVGLLELDSDAYEGYTLFAPMASKTTYLLDICGREVHSWQSNNPPGLSVYLLEDGTLLRAETLGNSTFPAGGSGGGFEVLEWDGSVVWEFEYSTSDYCQHHDVEMLPNGNVLLVAWEKKTAIEAIAAGRDPSILADGNLWPDSIIEVEPDAKGGGTIVWEWHLWDHLVQDYDNTKDNFGVVADHPELVDLNFVDYPTGVADWTHINAVDYNQDLDQIVLSVHNFHELWIIDHSTTTAEAASHLGGDSGMGGDLLYRWGNPQTYGAGNTGDQLFFAQHDSNWIEPGLAGEGNILVFNNGKKIIREYSTVDEITPPLNGSDLYDYVTGQPYGPDALAWSYTASAPEDFFSHNISGAQRLANGNTLICDGASGTFFEVTYDKQVVWKYLNPVSQFGIVSQGDDFGQVPPDVSPNPVFRAYRYGPGYPGLSGKDLTPGDYIEGAK